MRYVISVPRSFCTAYRAGYKPPRIWFDGYVSKEDGQWQLTDKLKKSHRWSSAEKAEAALILIVGKLPDIVGRAVIVAVTKEMDKWTRVRSARDW